MQESEPRTGYLATQPSDLSERGWTGVDVLLVTGDCHADHPSFPAALLGRLLQASGYKVGVVARPDVASCADVARLGPPRLFAGVTAGALDSMVANYTAQRKPRSDDAYAPDGKAGGRPDRAVTVYSNLLRQAFGKSVPIVAGGIEASLRRFAHYDYWSDRVRRSLLMDCGADILLAGMAEETVVSLARILDRSGVPNLLAQPWESWPAELLEMPGLVRRIPASAGEPSGAHILPTAEAVASDEQAHCEAFVLQERCRAERLAQRNGGMWVIANPMPRVTAPILDRVSQLPFTRRMHPDYGQQVAPALRQVQFSVTTHRGCFGGCAFCAITALQGKEVVSRSRESVLQELTRIVGHPDFRGTVPDVGGPTANMWGLCCTAKGACQRPSCLAPAPCPNLTTDQEPYRQLLEQAAAVPGVKHLYVTTGIRMDLAMLNPRLVADLAHKYTAGHLKVAPEHVVPAVLKAMRKPFGGSFDRFLSLHQDLSRKAGKVQFVLPYMMAAHPGCTLSDMVDAAVYLAQRGIKVEQCQIFTPTPGTASTVMYATGLDPYTRQPLFVERDPAEKELQKALLLYHLPEQRENVRKALKRLGRVETASLLWGEHPSGPTNGSDRRDPGRNSRRKNRTQ